MMIARLILAIAEVVFGIPEAIFRTIGGLLAALRVRMHKRYDYRQWLIRDLADCKTILELGCGRYSPILQIRMGDFCHAIDIWEPYIELHNKNNDYDLCAQADILEYNFPEKQYDAVVIFDVMEHLDRKKVRDFDLFAKMEKAAKKKVIIFTPNGFVENDEVDDDPFQRHISAWEPEDYQRRGYTVKGATGIRWILGKASLPKWHPYSFWSIIAMISQPYIYNHPKWAWHSYAVKNVR